MSKIDDEIQNKAIDVFNAMCGSGQYDTDLIAAALQAERNFWKAHVDSFKMEDRLIEERGASRQRELSAKALEKTARDFLPDGTWTTPRVRELLVAIAKTLRGETL